MKTTGRAGGFIGRPLKGAVPDVPVPACVPVPDSLRDSPDLADILFCFGHGLGHGLGHEDNIDRRKRQSLCNSHQQS